MSSYRLLVQSSMMVLALGIGGTAQAQTTVEPDPTAPQATAASPTLPAAESPNNTIIVTGSILRQARDRDCLADYEPFQSGSAVAREYHHCRCRQFAVE
jgi:hypothetical protein